MAGGGSHWVESGSRTARTSISTENRFRHFSECSLSFAMGVWWVDFASTSVRLVQSINIERSQGTFHFNLRGRYCVTVVEFVVSAMREGFL